MHIRGDLKQTIAVVVPIFVISRVCILRSQKLTTLVVVRIEDIWIRKFRFVLMETPDIDEDDCALRQ